MKKLTENIWIKRALIVFVILLPVLMLYFLLILNGKGLNPQIFIPVYNDEVTWHSLIGAMIRFGQPLGYEGYNLTHAVIGNFGPWGPASLMPYALIGIIIGWNLHSMVIANILLLSLAIGLFILLTQPDMKQLLWIGCGYVCMNVTVGYSMLSMAESLRYALAIILVGMLVRIYKNEGKKHFCHIVFPILLLYSIQVYLFFVALIPIYIWIILKRKNVFVRLAACVIITGAVTAVSYYVWGLTISPYIDSTRDTLLQEVLGNPYQGIVEVIRTFFLNAKTLNPVKLSTLAIYDESGVHVWFFVIYWVMIWMTGRQALKEKTGFFPLVSVYLLLGFLAGYCALYSGDYYTLVRGLNTGIVLVLFFLIYSKKENIIKTFLLLAVVGSVSSYWYYADRIEEKTMAYAQAEHILEEREKISELIRIYKDQDVWENTIAHYGEVTNVYLELPVGIGTNYIVDENTINSKARWAAISKYDGEEFYRSMQEKLEENGHKVIYENEDLIILEYSKDKASQK